MTASLTSDRPAGSIIGGFIRAHPVIAYYALACAVTWALMPLLGVSMLFGLLALFGPAVAAIVVRGVRDGRPGVRDLLGSAVRWRASPRWYALAIGYPVLATAIGLAAYLLAGHAMPALTTVAAIELVLFALVVGEELGWRGFMVDELLRRRSPLVTALVVGGAWALWHAPLYLLPGMPSFGQPYLVFVAWVVPLSVGMTWLWMRTRSTLLATVMHGTANVALGILLGATTFDQKLGFSALGYAVLAVAAAVVMGGRRLRRS